MIVIKNLHAGSPTAPKTERLQKLHWGLLLVVSVFSYGSHAPLINLCKVDGKIPFSSSSTVILIELLKLLISSVLLLIQDLKSTRVSLSWRDITPFALPALLYAINNNLVVYMQLFMDPSTFQVLSNFKIASTAILYSLILRKRLSLRKWLALCLLTIAGVFHTYGGVQNESGPLPETDFYITPLGILLLSVYCLISGLSAVYTELILKTQKLPLNLQNFFLYLFGITINLGVHAVEAQDGGFFQGFSVWVLVIIATQALNGLLMSVVMKHSSNITRLFVISCSMLVNAVLSVLLFDLQLKPLFFLAVLSVVFSVHLYYQV
ncbi:probable UDP-sugar transporter protein SLC35A4 [Latimeria chalumnae]|uniref:probable UDP-sugar transporter protein SLC35A4 n=1 Tax=Latimeria chalumnae TaxID=7897 RepID=UPI0003C1A3EB|nr:PREDICTED: probable UDP-sugar transporter protein SLC35A4 [Latimeria chalumnae]|eukprot:XP_006007628.1 PREDICTED: probable UDP-sugar transporter protein SLC35A4 [Latimeria chalumnae]